MDNTHFEQIWLLSSKNMEELVGAKVFSEKLCINKENSEKIEIFDNNINPVLNEGEYISLGTFYIDIDIENNEFLFDNLSDNEFAEGLFKRYNCKSHSKVCDVFKHKEYDVFLTKSFDEKNYVNSDIDDIKEYWLLSYLQTICVYLKNENKELDISKYKFNFILHDKDFNKEMNGKIGLNELELKVRSEKLGKQIIEEELIVNKLELKSEYLNYTDFKDLEGLSKKVNAMWGFQHTDSDYIFKDIIANPDFFEKESLNKKTAHEKLLEVLNIENLVEDFFNSLN